MSEFEVVAHILAVGRLQSYGFLLHYGTLCARLFHFQGHFYGEVHVAVGDAAGSHFHKGSVKFASVASENFHCVL